jgi:hypothetical protein
MTELVNAFGDQLHRRTVFYMMPHSIQAFVLFPRHIFTEFGSNIVNVHLQRLIKSALLI